MAWRFKASKYKNAAPIVPKPEACIRDICVGSYQTYGNNIAASAAFMAFNVDHNGSSLAVLPIDDCGRKSKTMPFLHAHTDTVTDMDFSPFHDGLLATGSQDCLVKLWHIPEGGLEESLTNPECTFYHKQRRVETVCFHPTADCLLTTTSFATLTLWDINTEKELLSNQDHCEVIQSISWKKDGTLLATSCKDKQVRILDPRCKQGVTFSHSANSHQSIKDSRVVWLGDQNKIITTGFDSGRQREVFVRDLRSFEEPEKSLTLDSSTGILIPLFDSDTGMLFLAGKGDTTISCLEVVDREPYLIEGIRHNGEQTKGACLVPKRALNVMQGEVNRLLQLTSTTVIPIMYQVPRKSYREFHGDLFPETSGCHPGMSATQWLEGHNVPVARISLDPAKNQTGQRLEPRLGPKPFALPKLNFSGSGDSDKAASDVLLDKVFSVPSVPGSQDILSGSNKPQHNQSSNNSYNQPEQTVKESLNSSLGKNIELGDLSLDEPTLDEKIVVPEADNNGDGSPVDDDYSANSPNKTPTTAERRKLFEFATPGGGDVSTTDGGVISAQLEEDDKLEDFERASLQRSSIAERRRLYENRSLSVQDEKDLATSPTPLRRKDSFKLPGVKEGQGDGEGVGKPVPMQRQHSLEQPVQMEKQELIVTPTPKRTSTVFGRVSKFRHLKGTPLHKSTHIENIRNVSRQISGECDGFHANARRVAVPLGGPGGKIAVFELAKTGKLPDGVIPTLVHGTNVMDFAWDPFNPNRLAVGCDDGIIRLWLLPETGLTEPTNTPTTELAGSHTEKIYFIKFHPLASDVLASAAYDMTIRIWDLGTQKEQIVLTGHTDQIFSMAWSPCGAYIATVCRDSKLRIYEPRASCEPIREGKGPVGSRGARIIWALDGNFLVVLGFDKVSERQISVFNSKDLNTPLNTVGLDVSPAILIPFYDEDSSTLFLTGKGDSTIYTYEVTEEAPYLCALSHHRCGTLHQGLSFLPKNECDVGSVEFARALRLTNNIIEPLSFTVPRIKSELFQDDLFPPTKITWQASMSSVDWFKGGNMRPGRISLQPAGMESLSSVQVSTPVEKKGSSKDGAGSFSGAKQPFNRLGWNADMSGATKQKQDQIQRAVSNRMEVNLRLEQDEMEGVDEKEWEES